MFPLYSIITETGVKYVAECFNLSVIFSGQLMDMVQFYCDIHALILTKKSQKNMKV